MHGDSTAGVAPRPSRPYDCDVLVVGGRVAGASTAMLLARAGHKVVLVDRAPLPSDTVSTHAILRSGVLQLSRWGLLDRVLAAGTPEARHITLGFGGQKIEFAVKAEHGVEALLAPRREVLDGILLEAAVQAGVEVHDRTRLIRLLRSPAGSVTGAVVERDGVARTLRTRFVVGADGTNSRVGGLVGARPYHSHPATNAVHYAYFSNVEVEGFWFQFTAGTNVGSIRTNDGLNCVFVGRPVSEMDAFRSDPDGEFHRLLHHGSSELADRVRSGARVTPFRGTPGLNGFVRTPWGPGWVLVGDAGHTKDPISAHGISDALRDAELGARAIDRSLRAPGEAVQALDAFHRDRDLLALRIYRESQALAAYGWDADEASTRMRVISEEVRAECAYLDALPDWPPAHQRIPSLAAQTV